MLLSPRHSKKGKTSPLPQECQPWESESKSPPCREGTLQPPAPPHSTHRRVPPLQHASNRLLCARGQLQPRSQPSWLTSAQTSLPRLSKAAGPSDPIPWVPSMPLTRPGGVSEGSKKKPAAWFHCFPAPHAAQRLTHPLPRELRSICSDKCQPTDAEPRASRSPRETASPQHFILRKKAWKNKAKIRPASAAALRKFRRTP